MGKKVLLAEDSLTIQKVFELTFRGSDIALTMVDNGEDAIRLAGEIAPDLVVADVTLPGKNGFEVAASLCSPDRGKAVPVLILSGTLAPFDEEKFKKSGAGGVLFKPFESQDLFEKIEHVLGGGEPARAVAAPKAAPKAEEKQAAAEETWDFTDVIEEAEKEASGAQGSAKPASVPLPHGADAFAGLVSPEPKGEGAVSLGEFDVSIEDLEGPSKEVLSAPAAPLSDVVGSFDEAVEGGVAPEEAGASKAPPHITGELFQDAPPAVTDLTSALDSAGEFEDIDLKDEMALLEKEVAARAKTPEPLVPRKSEAKPREAAPPPPAPPPRPASLAAPPSAPPPRPASLAAPPRSAPPPSAPPPSHEAPRAAAPGAPPAAPLRRPAVETRAGAPPAAVPRPPAPESRAGVSPAAVAAPIAGQDEFSARAREIIEKVAAEAVERAMWDVMDRLSEELSAKIREAVETVAWEVIPQTAETLIREEIARIRGQAEKKSS